MKNVKAFYFEDLEKEVQEKTKTRVLQDIVMAEIDSLENAVVKGLMSEKEYYANLGCSKSYAETTGWFIPSCYYEAHQESVDKEVEEITKAGLYNSSGTWFKNI